MQTIFGDSEKAFDSVTRNKLFSVLKKKSLYSNSLTTARVHGVTGKRSEFNKGVQQGCKLSPLLFLNYMDKIVKA